MNKIQDLLDYIKRSNVIMINYNFKNERIKDKLISNLNYIDVSSNIDLQFSYKSFIRSRKIDSIFDDVEFTYPEYLLLDTNQSGLSKDDKNELLENIRSEIIRSNGIKLIITNVTNLEFDSSASGVDLLLSYISISGTSFYKSMLVCDIALILYDNNIKTIKNRFGPNGNIYSSEDLLSYLKSR
jgi:hypothetical protein